MSSRYFYSNGKDGRQEPGQKPPGRVSCKTLMTRDYLSSKSGSRGMELAAGLGQVNGYTIAKALVNEKELSEKIEGLSRTNPENSRKLQRAERVEKFANSRAHVVILFAGIASGVLAMSTIPLLAGFAWWVSMIVVDMLAGEMLRKDYLGGKDLEDARKKLADAQEAKAELCAKTGLSERMVELLQALPIEADQKHTVLKQAIFQDVPEDYVIRVAGILEGVVSRGENLKEFAERRLKYLSRDMSQAEELAKAAEGKAESGDNIEACKIFAGAAEILIRALDHAGAAEMYRKASDASLVDKKKAAELSAKAGECYLKSGDRAAARERYEWASMIVGDSDSGLSSDYQGKAVALI